VTALPPTTWTFAAVALGSNLGPRAEHLAAALSMLESSPQVRALRTSDWIETAPEGGPPGQGPFLNGAVVLETTLSPLRFLRLLQRCEARRGRDREREGPGGARTLDLDLLVHGAARLATPDLRLPHARMGRRRFVLEPLASLVPELVPPGWRSSVASTLALLPPSAPARVQLTGSGRGRGPGQSAPLTGSPGVSGNLLT
jgi:2-amino-4-hydroxy-6-hydroxymethyldihydropteridine diphosphokinase